MLKMGEITPKEEPRKKIDAGGYFCAEELSNDFHDILWAWSQGKGFK